jgi:hypothetical protein
VHPQEAAEVLVVRADLALHEGVSLFEEMPTITLPLATVGLDHAYTSFWVDDGICTTVLQIVDPSLPLSL